MTMDDPSIIPIPSEVNTDQVDTMAALSPAKRPIQLGVINTAGMKSSNVNRKRRWDQPPDASSETPCVKKVHLNDSCESPNSSFDSTLERVAEQSSEILGSGGLNSNDNSHREGGREMNHGSDILLDIPSEGVCERHSEISTGGSSLDGSAVSEPERTIIPDVVCSGSVSDDKTNSESSELRLGVIDSDNDKCPNTVSDKPVVLKEESISKPSTVISHQSEELRRIMSSYDEGTSDSDISENSTLPPSSTVDPGNAIEVGVVSISSKISEDDPERNQKSIIPNSIATSVSENETSGAIGFKICPYNNLSNENSPTDQTLFINDVDSMGHTEISIKQNVESLNNIPVNKSTDSLEYSGINCSGVSHDVSLADENVLPGETFTDKSEDSLNNETPGLRPNNREESPTNLQDYCKSVTENEISKGDNDQEAPKTSNYGRNFELNDVGNDLSLHTDENPTCISDPGKDVLDEQLTVCNIEKYSSSTIPFVNEVKELPNSPQQNKPEISESQVLQKTVTVPSSSETGAISPTEKKYTIQKADNSSEPDMSSNIFDSALKSFPTFQEVSCNDPNSNVIKSGMGEGTSCETNDSLFNEKAPGSTVEAYNPQPASGKPDEVSHPSKFEVLSFDSLPTDGLISDTTKPFLPDSNELVSSESNHGPNSIPQNKTLIENSSESVSLVEKQDSPSHLTEKEKTSPSSDPDLGKHHCDLGGDSTSPVHLLAPDSVSNQKPLPLGSPHLPEPSDEGVNIPDEDSKTIHLDEDIATPSDTGQPLQLPVELSGVKNVSEDCTIELEECNVMSQEMVLEEIVEDSATLLENEDNNTLLPKSSTLRETPEKESDIMFGESQDESNVNLSKGSTDEKEIAVESVQELESESIQELESESIPNDIDETIIIAKENILSGNDKTPEKNQTPTELTDEISCHEKSEDILASPPIEVYPSAESKIIEEECVATNFPLEFDKVENSPDDEASIPRQTVNSGSLEFISEEAELKRPNVSLEDNELRDFQSPIAIQEPVVNNNEDSSKMFAGEIESYDVIEEVVTCETSNSDKVVETEIEKITNEDENARFASEETQDESSADDLEAVIDNDTFDLKVSDNENQNELTIDAEVCVDTNENSSTEVSKTINTDQNKEVLLESIIEKSSLEEMECEDSVNSIMKSEISPLETPMEVDLSPNEVQSAKSKPGDSSFSAAIGSVKSGSPVAGDNSKIIPSQKTISSHSLAHNKEVTPKIEVESVNTPSKKLETTSKLELSTLKIYKDNLSINTDDPVKKHKSPKLPLDSSVQSLHSQPKQFEYTLKIAKDTNTNVPKAIMSPKSNLSPSGSWKLDSGSLSPNSPGESASLKLKLSKSPSGFSNDLVTTISAVAHRNSPGIEEKASGGISEPPRQPLEMGSALKMMIEGDKSEPRTSLLEQALCNSKDVQVAKKRGRPRKHPGEGSPSTRSPVPGGGERDPPPETSPILDTSGEGSEAGSGRHVRSCRARATPFLPKPRKPRGGCTAAGGSTRGGGRGGARGVARPIATPEEAEKIQEKLSEKEKEELAKIEARKEKMRLDRLARSEAKKAKKLAKKLKDEERRKRQLAEKAEKAAAAAPQVFEEETRMSASESRGHTPAPSSSRLMQPSEVMEESQTSSTPKPGNHKGRMEIPIDPESDEVRVDQLAEYQWQGGELNMIQEQVSLYLGVKSFKRKYPDLKRRLVEAEERTFLEDSGLVPKSMCDLGLTAVSSAEILDIMYQDFPDKYEEFRQHVRDKQAREMSFKQKALASQTQNARAKGELRELALEAAAMWNSNLNKERREERRCTLDLQTYTVHYPKLERDKMSKNPLRPGLYPVSVIPGQYSDYYKMYTPTELMYFPLNTVMYGPLKPNARRDGSDSSSSSSDDSSGLSSDESGDEDSAMKECKICNGEKKTNSEAHPEILLQCSQCKGLCHPTCQEITPEMLPHIKKYSWHCSNCKKCMKCKDKLKEEKMLFCDLCDRGYHLSCAGLQKSPEGRWHCAVCSFCTACGSKDPGGPEWFYEYKKTDKGVRLYQRTLCAPCSKTALM